MIILDASIVNIALPHAQAALHISDASRQWALTAYTLTFGGLLLLGGRIADYLGRKRTFLVGLFGFAAASALGGAAQTAGWLFGARAMQGIFAAVLAPAVLSLITTTFTEPQGAGQGLRGLRRHLRHRGRHRPDRRRRAHRVPQLALDAAGQHPDRTSPSPSRRSRCSRRAGSRATAITTCRARCWPRSASPLSSTDSPRRRCTPGPRAHPDAGQRAGVVLLAALRGLGVQRAETATRCCRCASCSTATAAAPTSPSCWRRSSCSRSSCS